MERNRSRFNQRPSVERLNPVWRGGSNVRASFAGHNEWTRPRRKEGERAVGKRGIRLEPNRFTRDNPLTGVKFTGG